MAPSASSDAPQRHVAGPRADEPGALVAALRSAGFSCPIGAGTPSNFTEFNRNPPERDCDFVFFGIAANVHAADDLSVMETLETYPALIESAGALLPGKPIWLGPLTIGSRHNPYGAAVAPNPDGGRIACAREDPRQGALFWRLLHRSRRRGCRRGRGGAA